MDHISNYLSLLDAYELVLVPSYTFAAELNRRAAHARPEGSFATIAQTFYQWAAVLWERFGDGRHLASETTTAAALAQVLESHTGELKNRPGLAVSTLKMLQRVSGLPAFEQAVMNPANSTKLLPAEQELLLCVAQARQLLSKAHACEFGTACAWLAAQAPEFVGPEPVHTALLTDGPLPEIAQLTLDAFVQAGFIKLDRFNLDGEPQATAPAAELLQPAPELELRFAFPSGDYATPQLVQSIVEEYRAQGPLAISVKEPLKLYRALAPVCAEKGIRVAVRHQVPFAQTAFGRAYCSVRACLDEELLPWSRALLEDGLASPINRKKLGSTWYDDLARRADRLLERDKVCNQLLANKGITAVLLKLILEPHIQEFSLMEERLTHESPLSRTEVAESYAALSLLKQLFEDGLRFELSYEQMYHAFLPLLERAHVRVALANYEAEPGQAPELSIMGQYQLSQMMAQSCASVVMLDLDSDSYPVNLRDDACSMLLRKLEVPLGEDPLEAQKRMWRRIVAAPTHTLILGRCLNNADAEPRYHAALLEEFIDLYRSDPSQTKDIDNPYALPANLQDNLLLMGEEQLLHNVYLRQDEQELKPAQQTPLDAVSVRVAHRNIDVPSTVSASDTSSELVLSPSQIEAYIACPAKWFATRRMGAELPDELLGFAQQGLFRHDVLQNFYVAFQAAGFDKVRASNRKDAQNIFETVFEATCKKHLEELSPKHRAAFMLNTTEQRVLELIHKELVGWLDFEERFLKPYESSVHANSVAPLTRRYVPRAFEFDLDPYNISYAGARLKGTVDRIDVDTASNSFVVVDYKGSLKTHYNLGLDADGAPNIAHKIQTIIYTHALLKSPQALRDLGLQVDEASAVVPHAAGAFYISYQRGNAMRGFYLKDELTPGTDGQVSEVLPTLTGGFALDDLAQLNDILQSVETQVASKVVTRMSEGEVLPKPSDKSVCRYCSIYGCPRRS